MRNLNVKPTFIKNSSPFKLSLLTLSILTISACGAGGGGSFEADVHYQNDKNTPINEQKKQQNNHHKNNNNDENEELQTGYAVEIPIRNIAQTDKPYTGGDPIIEAILGDYDQAEHYLPVAKITPFTNGNLAESAFQTQLQTEGSNGKYKDGQLREPDYLLNSKKLAFVLNEEFGVPNPYDNNNDYNNIHGAVDGSGSSLGGEDSKTHPKHIKFFNNIDVGYATVFSRYKDETATKDNNRSGMGGFVYYRGVNPSQALPTKDQDLEYQGIWAYTTDADINRYKDLITDAEAVDANSKSSSAAGFDDASSGEHGISRGGTSYAEPKTLGHIAKFNINFGKKSFKGDLSVVKGDLRGGEYQYKDKTGQNYLVDTHPEMTKEERRKAATIKRFELEGEIKGNTFAGNANAVKNNDAFDNYFHDSQDMKGSFFGDNAEELAGKFTNQNANGDNSLFVVFGGKRSPESEKLVQGTDGANKDQEKIMDAFVVGYDLPSENGNPIEVAYIRNNLDNFGNKEVLHINGQTINLFEDREIVRENNRYDLDNLIIGRYIAKDGSSIRDQFKQSELISKINQLKKYWEEVISLDVNENMMWEDEYSEDDVSEDESLVENQSMIDEENKTEKDISKLSKEEILSKLQERLEEINDIEQQNENLGEYDEYVMDPKLEMLQMRMMELFGKLDLGEKLTKDEQNTLDFIQNLLSGSDEKEIISNYIKILSSYSDKAIHAAMYNWLSEDSLSDADKALIQSTITNNFNGGAYFLQGNSTPLKDMPATGTANYQGKWFGRIEKDGRYASPNQTAANINVDFGNKKLTGELTGDHSRKVFDIRADIHGNQFKGTANTPSEGFNIADSSNSSHSQPIYVHMKDAKVQGGFFGPKAQDLGGSVLYNDAKTKTKAVAVFGATKQSK